MGKRRRKRRSRKRRQNKQIKLGKMARCNGRISSGQTWLHSEFEASLGYMGSLSQTKQISKKIGRKEERVEHLLRP